MDRGQVTPARFAEVVQLPLGRPADALDPYAQSLAAFREHADGVKRAAPCPRKDKDPAPVAR